MKYAWILASATVFAQTPPAEFEKLTITVSETTERWEGEIRLHESVIAADLQKIVVRGANAGLLEASVSGVDVAKSAGRNIGDWYVWDVAAKPGELIRFVAEQPVSFGPWREIAAHTPYRVKSGTLRLRAPSLAVISKDARALRTPGPEMWEWTLDGRAAGDSAPLAVASRLRSWADYAAWLRQSYPAKAEAPRAASLAAVLRTAEDATESDPWVAQARLAAALEAMRLRPVRYALGAKENVVDPSAMTAALVRVEVEGRALWIDTAKMTPPRREWNGARALRLDGSWETLDFGAASTEARLQGELSADGTLTASLELSTAGGEAPLHDSAGKRRLRASSGEIGKSGWLIPAQSKLVIDEAKFVDRIAKKTDHVLALLALDSKLNAKGSYVEEIELKLPPNYGVTARRNLDEQSAAGSYKSSAVVEDGKLKVRRELTLTGLGADEKFWKTVVDDQKRPFAIERRGAVDREAVLRETLPYQEGRAGHAAFLAQEMELAIELLKRATQRNGKDSFAWHYLARSHAALGKFDEAEAAFMNELAANPKDQFVWPQLAFLYMANKEWAKALGAFDKQLALVPNDAYSIRMRPFPLMSLNRWEEAERAAALALPAVPQLQTLPVIHLSARICQGKVENARAEMTALLDKLKLERSSNMPAEHLARCGKELALAEQLIEKALDLSESTRDGSYSGRHLPSAFAFQGATGDFRRTRASIWRQLGKTEAAEREEREVRALLEDDAGDDWLPMTPPSARAPEHWVVGVPVYCFVVSAADGSAEVVDSLAEHDPNGAEAAAIAKGLRFPQVTTEGTLVQTANVVKLIRTAGGGIEAFRARRHKGTDLLRALARERFAPTQR